MMEHPRILFVVEGRRTEHDLVLRMTELFGIRTEIYSVNANIFALYQKVRDDPFATTVDVLSEMRNSESDKRVLAQDYTDVFLVFDCDAQHTLEPAEYVHLSPKQIALRNLEIVRRMAERFDESTDPQKGKLLVNYPMVESFRDCDDFFERGYADRSVAVTDLKGYKARVGLHKLVRRHVDTFTQDEIERLIRMNAYKLNALSNGIFSAVDYEDFLRTARQDTIAAREEECVAIRAEISVLNTLLFFPFEFFGNRLGFYDKIVK